MSYDIRLPNITATTEKGQLEQIQSYLYQFAEQLKYAINIIDINTSVMTSTVKTVASSVDSPTQEQKLKQFSNLKNLIISSADIVNAYYETIRYRLEGKYEALSPEFGTFVEETKSAVEETSKNLTTYYEVVQTVEGWQMKTDAYIRTGLLGYDEDGKPIHGVEVGSVTDEVYEGMARFTPIETVFYDGHGNKMATLSGDELIVGRIVCSGEVYLGSFVIDTKFGFTIKPSGRSVRRL